MATATGRAHHQATFAVLTAAVVAFATLQSLVIPVLPTIQESLHTTQNTVTWVLTAYLLSASIFTPIMGRLGDMWGKERMLLVTLALLTAGSVLAALARSVEVMIAARAVQGIGGGVMPLAFGIVRDEFPREKVAGAIGVLAALTAAGAGVAIVLAGPIVDALGYHWLFWIPVIVLSVALVATHLVVPESPVRAPGRVSWPAALLLSSWLVALILPISQAPHWGWTSGRFVALVGVAVVLAAAWVAVESRSQQPLIDMRMMRLPAVWTTNLVALLLGAGMYAVFAFVPEFVQTDSSAGYGFGASITESGLILLPSCVFMFLFGMASGRLSARYGPRAVLVGGLLVTIVPFLLLTVAHGGRPGILVAMTAMGVGLGLAFASMSSLVVEAVPPDQTGVASGMNANIRTIGGAFGAAVMSSVVTSGAHHRGFPAEAGYTRGFALLTVVTVIAVGAAMLVPRMHRAPEPEEADGRVAPHAELGLAGGVLAGD